MHRGSRPRAILEPMGAVEGFFRLWEKTRATYGEGTPQTGEQFDHSATLRELETQLGSTAPGDQWTGTAADAYGAVNTEHRRVIGELANLDQRLGAQVTESAQIVTAGRDNLETLRYQVAAIAARLPEGTAGDAMRYTLVSDGTNKLTEIVRRSSNDLNGVGAEIDRIGHEYEALSNQKFGGGFKESPSEDALGNDDDDAEDGANQLDEPLPQDPEEFHEFWIQLTEEEKELLYQQDRFIGNSAGMPFEDKHHFNERHLAELLETTQADVDRMQDRYDDLARDMYMGDKSPEAGRELAALTTELREARHQLDGYRAVETALNPAGDDALSQVPRFLAHIDDQGHAAVSVGNPDEASRNAVLVPGTGQDMAEFVGSDDKSQAMFRATVEAHPGLSASDVSVTTWMGYDRPMNLYEAAWPDRAQNGGAALSTFLDGMHASQQGQDAIHTVVGHSYGSTLVGGAATGDNQLAADNVIAVGSPGMLVAHASQLELPDGANVYAMTAQNDIINAVTDKTLGLDPNGMYFGSERLWSDPGPGAGPGGVLPSVDAHSSYWSPGNPGLENMGHIIAGLPPPETVTAFGRRSQE